MTTIFHAKVWGGTWGVVWGFLFGWVGRGFRQQDIQVSNMCPSLLQCSEAARRRGRKTQYFSHLVKGNGESGTKAKAGLGSRSIPLPHEGTDRSLPPALGLVSVRLSTLTPKTQKFPGYIGEIKKEDHEEGTAGKNT